VKTEGFECSDTGKVNKTRQNEGNRVLRWVFRVLFL